MQNNLLIIICGPTAIGKTQLAADLALHFGCEIVSADSRQLFKELNIGTAKPSGEILEKVNHHFISSHSVTDLINAGVYEELCISLLENLFKKNPVQIMVGGTGLYINAVINRMDKLPASDKEIRASLQQVFKEKGIAVLQQQLKLLDKKTFDKIDLSNPNRLMRAIEVCLLTGRPYSEMLNHGKPKRNFNHILIGLNLEREVLYQHINNRVDEMMQQGLMDEVKSLRQFKNLNALQTVGYKELFDFFDGKYSLTETVDLIKKNTRNYAKRQLTWFRKMEGIKWFNPEEKEKMITEITTQL